MKIQTNIKAGGAKINHNQTSLKIQTNSEADGAKIKMHDPEAGKNFVANLPAHLAASCTLVADPYDAADGAHALILATEWREYRSPDFDRLRKLMASPALFDGRNQWDRAHVERLGFHYAGIGR